MREVCLGDEMPAQGFQDVVQKRGARVSLPLSGKAGCFLLPQREQFTMQICNFVRRRKLRAAGEVALKVVGREKPVAVKCAGDFRLREREVELVDVLLVHPAAGEDVAD